MTRISGHLEGDVYGQTDGPTHHFTNTDDNTNMFIIVDLPSNRRIEW